MKTGKCPKCDCDKILANITTHGFRGEPVLLAVNQSPDAYLLTNFETTEMRAWVCEGCGYADFYATKPELLGRAIDLTKPTDRFKQKLLPYRVNSTPAAIPEKKHG